MKKVFILDDEFLIGRSLQIVVESLGHQTQIARTGEEALTLWLDFKPDLAFIDILMPGMSGLEFLQKISNKTTKIILMSAHDNLNQKEIKQANANLFVKKPFEDVFKLVEETLKLVL